MDVPDGRKHHGHPRPRTGGAALWAALTLGHVFGWLQLPIAGSEWICLHGLALMGALDDRHSLSPRIKALAGLGLAFTLAIPVAYAFALDRPVAMLMRLSIPTNPPYLTLPLLVLWFWAIPQSFNLIDGMDGLATGLALLIASFLLVGRGFTGTPFLLGALLATFLLNWPRAFHFLGDCGAYFLGGLLGLLALRTRAFEFPSLALWVFAYPILDMALVITIRFLRGRPLGAGDRNHLHHQWASIIGERWAVPLLWFEATALAVGPTGFPGSAWVCWPTLALMLAQCAFFVRRSLQESEKVPG
nr:MraY family glycosyltransferase [Geothrix sp.]